MEILGSADLYLRFVMAFVVVIALIGAATWIAKYMGFVTPLKRGSSKKRHLSVTESIAIDTKRRILLINLDGREDLICVGGANDFVVRSNIVRSVALTSENIMNFDKKVNEVEND